MQDNTIELAFCIDDGYAAYLSTLLLSIKENIAEGYVVRCHVFGKLNQSVCKKIKSIESDLFEVLYHSSFSDYDFLEISERYRDRLNEVTYYRFAVPQVLSHLDRVIFIDSDMIALKDISELWKVDLEGNIVGVVIDQLLGCDQLGQKQRGITSGKYFNAGMMIIDIKLWNEFKVSEKAIQLLIDNKGMEHNDQDALNIVLEWKCKFINQEWNAQTLLLTEQLVRDACLIHFCGQEKPWQITSEHPYTATYLQFMKRTPFADKPLEFFIDPIDSGLINQLKLALPNGGMIAIWGRGQRGRRLFYYIKNNLREYQVKYMVDKYNNSPYMGINVYSNISPELDIDALVIASVPFRQEIVDGLPKNIEKTIKII